MQKHLASLGSFRKSSAHALLMTLLFLLQSDRNELIGHNCKFRRDGDQQHFPPPLARDQAVSKVVPGWQSLRRELERWEFNCGNGCGDRMLARSKKPLISRTNTTHCFSLSKESAAFSSFQLGAGSILLLDWIRILRPNRIRISRHCTCIREQPVRAKQPAPFIFFSSRIFNDLGIWKAKQKGSCLAKQNGPDRALTSVKPTTPNPVIFSWESPAPAVGEIAIEAYAAAGEL